jgi:ADP-ribosyl-[dinitrogen reductase] hydrolase
MGAGRDVQDRAEGCLLGVCIGDAWGAPYEFKTGPLEIADRYGRGVFRTKPGAPTDDSTLALFAAEALAEQQPLGEPAAVDWGGYTRRLVKWWWSGPPDVGGATARAALGWKDGHAPARDEGVQGNGSMMAAAAIGVAWADSPSQAAEAGRAFAALTHPSAVAADANAAFCELVAHLVASGEAPDDPRFRPPLPGPVSGSGASIGWVKLAWAVAAEALWSTIERGVAPVDALRAVIAAGGDADTNGAIAGALLGARWGATAWTPWQLYGLKEASRARALALALRGPSPSPTSRGTAR